MKNTDDFSVLVGKVVTQVVARIWPPYFENERQNIDISIGLFLEGTGFIHIGVGEDNFHIEMNEIDFALPLYHWEEYSLRMDQWFAGDLNEIIGHEFYDFSGHPDFKKISGNEIIGVEAFYKGMDSSPFGLKLIFDSNSILISPNMDGTSVETDFFKENSSFNKVFSDNDFRVIKF